MEEIKRLHGKKTAMVVLWWTTFLLALGCMIALVVFLLLIGLEKGNASLFGILCAAMTGGIALFGGLTFLFVRGSEKASLRERDAIERSDGEESFLVGEDTFATFQENGLWLHSPKSKTQATVPYGEARFFSVCTRTAPRERGKWSVVIEIPASYVVKRAKKTDPPVLIETDGKERLYACLEAHGLSLLGEKRGTGGGKFHLLRSFVSPDKARRKRSAIFVAVGAAALAAGVGLAFWNAVVGTLIAVAGGYCALRAALSFRKARSVLAVFREGIFYREPKGTDNAFLKWEEIVSVSRHTADGGETIRVKCLYGDCELPYFEGAVEYIIEQFPEKRGA